MGLIAEQDRAYIRDNYFQGLRAPVRMRFFRPEGNCMFCKEIQALLEELAELSDKLTVEVHSFEAEPELAARYGIDKAPAIVLEGEKDYGVRFYGIPSGYEFVSLLEGIVDVSRGESEADRALLELIEREGKPVHIQVFVTPTCPYCPRMVRLAHQLAVASPLVRGDMIEAAEFPELADQYHVHGVPRTVINEVVHIEGAVPVPYFQEELARALEQTPARA